MKIARQGFKFVGLGVVLSILGALFWGKPMAAPGLFFALFCVYFFRDPERLCPAAPGKIYSPGDGVVLSVSREGPGDIVTARIFLSIFDVHIQRAPCAGRVDRIWHQPGSFRAAMKPAARANERCSVTIKPAGRDGVLAVEQIAGFVARRIECWLGEGDVVSAGQRYGIIYFGSQAAVHFPASARCWLKPGDRVAGGLTEIGEWTS